MGILNIFYQEPETDRWFKYDRYPRRIIRRIIRGKRRPGGVQTVAINLLKGLDRLAIPYRYNNFNYAKKHPDEVVCIIGKPHLLMERKWDNPVIFGAGIFSHPIVYPHIFEQKPTLKHLLVPGEWMRLMFKEYYGDKVTAWPVGIDTHFWTPVEKKGDFKVLVYDKIMWNYEETKNPLLTPILDLLNKKGLPYEYLRYGYYQPNDLKEKADICSCAIFLCEHETQGLAYQQILATGTPIFAWDQCGYWQDPSFYPHKVKYSPVSSTPYWDERCGMKFKNADEFQTQFDSFITKCKNNEFDPRSYIMENLTLEKCATEYVRIVNEIMNKETSTT